MVLLCFMLDLRTISPPVLRDLKQCLLQLANHYAISFSSGGGGGGGGGRGGGRCEKLQSDNNNNNNNTDRLGLCYIHKNKISCVDELKITYTPRGGNFRLRDFHHAVNNLPADGFLLPDYLIHHHHHHHDSSSFTTRIAATDVTLANLLSDEALFSWGGGGGDGDGDGGDRDIVKKVIVISSCLLDNINSMRKILADAADKCVSVEFVMLEQEPLHPQTFYEDLQEFINSTSDLENCSVRTHLPDTRVLCGLVKRWLQELRDELDEPLQAVFLFKNHLAGSTNRIFCNLAASVDQIIDGFIPCQTCRCHGLPLDSSGGSNTKRSSLCPETYQELGTNNTMDNAVRVGEHTVLFLPSFQNFPNFQQVSSPISFSVIERTNLGTLSEGVIVGNSYTVTPSPCQEMEATTDECDKSELNTQVFQGLCRVLHSLDQGLVCTSNCNMETKRDATFHCFYILQPSEKGPMLLRRLAGSEEILPSPDSAGSTDFIVPKEIQNSIQSSLSRVELRDYNPLLHERGFHPKLNLLVKESLQFGSVPPRRKELHSEPNLPRPEAAEMIKLLSSTKITGSVKEHEPKLSQATGGADKTAAARFTEEWEQLVIDEDCKMICSPPTACAVSSRPRIKATSLVLSPAGGGNKQLDEKTSRILERLEAPRKQPKTSGSSPVIIINSSSDACLPKKKPLVPFAAPTNHATEQSMTSSQPLKPNFQRLKRKQR